jgi:hypothetical protein
MTLAEGEEEEGGEDLLLTEQVALGEGKQRD